MNEKAAKIVSLAKERLGEPYVFGAIGEACIPANRDRRKNSAYPSIVSRCQVLSGTKSTCNGCAWQGKQIYDCRGFTYWILKQVGIIISTVGATTQYNDNQAWDRRGPLSEMPDLVCCVFKYRNGKMQHTGLHIGGGKIIHCSTTVKTGKTTDSGWTHYAIPKGLYSAEELAAVGVSVEKGGEIPTQTEKPVNGANLAVGSKGEQVKELQNKLLSLGYSLPRYGADGSFGAETENAVKLFQYAAGLADDGIVGPLTRAALEKAMAEKEADPALYSVTIPNLNEAQMQSILSQYPAALVVKNT